jgi:hypothetical protein
MDYGIIIELDRPRTLRFGHRALKAAEQLLKKKIAELDTMSFEEIEKVMYAGLKADDETLNLDKVGKLLDEYGSPKIHIDAMMKALNLAMGGNKDEEKNV